MSTGTTVTVVGVARHVSGETRRQTRFEMLAAAFCPAPGSEPPLTKTTQEYSYEFTPHPSVGHRLRLETRANSEIRSAPASEPPLTFRTGVQFRLQFPSSPRTFQ